MLYYIYRIVVGDQYYIGSTKKYDKRCKCHIQRSILGHCDKSNYPVYIAMRASPYTFEIIQEVDVISRMDARMLEQLEMDKYPFDKLLNGKRAYTSEEDLRTYRQEHKDEIKIRMKKWNENKKQDDEYMEKKRAQKRAEYDRKCRFDPEFKAKRTKAQRDRRAKKRALLLIDVPIGRT